MHRGIKSGMTSVKCGMPGRADQGGACRHGFEEPPVGRLSTTWLPGSPSPLPACPHRPSRLPPAATCRRRSACPASNNAAAHRRARCLPSCWPATGHPAGLLPWAQWRTMGTSPCQLPAFPACHLMERHSAHPAGRQGLLHRRACRHRKPLRRLDLQEGQQEVCAAGGDCHAPIFVKLGLSAPAHSDRSTCHGLAAACSKRCVVRPRPLFIRCSCSTHGAIDAASRGNTQPVCWHDVDCLVSRRCYGLGTPAAVPAPAHCMLGLVASPPMPCACWSSKGAPPCLSGCLLRFLRLICTRRCALCAHLGSAGQLCGVQAPVLWRRLPNRPALPRGGEIRCSQLPPLRLWAIAYTYTCADVNHLQMCRHWFMLELRDTCSWQALGNVLLLGYAQRVLPLPCCHCCQWSDCPY